MIPDRESVTRALQWEDGHGDDREKIVVRARRSSSDEDEDEDTRPSSEKPAWNRVSPVGFTIIQQWYESCSRCHGRG